MKRTTETVTEASLRASTADAAASSSGKLRLVSVVVCVLIVVGVFAGLLPRWKHRTALRSETRELAMPSFSTVLPVQARVEDNLPLPAEIKPLVEAPIYARASGYLKRYLVDMGAVVKEGDLLAEIDAPELNQELAQARGQRAQAQAALAIAKITADRWADLLKTESVSDQEAAEKKADLDLKTANLAAAEANVHRLEELQSFEQLRAPFAGNITARWTDVGQLIAATSGKELFRLAQTSTLRVYVRLPHNLAQTIEVGQVAELTVPERGGRSFAAKVVRTAGAVASDSRTLLVELQVDNEHGDLLAGTYGQVRFTHANAASHLTLPSNTLLFRAEGPQVGVVDPTGKVQLRKVTLGRDSGATVEIIDGVTAADRVIINPPDSLVDGVVGRVVENQGVGPAAQKDPPQKKAE